MTYKEPSNYYSHQPLDEFTSKILNKIDAFACIIDIHRQKIIWANNHFTSKTGLTLPDLSNMPVDELLFFIHPDYRKVAIDELMLIDNTDCDDLCGLVKVRDKNDHWIWILSTWIVHEKNTTGKIDKILFFAREVDIEQLYRQIGCIRHLGCEGQTNKIVKLLSQRERKVIELITDGYSDRRISEYLGISIHTAKTHRKRIIHKMGLRNSGALIRYAVENGLSASEFQL